MKYIIQVKEKDEWKDTHTYSEDQKFLVIGFAKVVENANPPLNNVRFITRDELGLEEPFKT